MSHKTSLNSTFIVNGNSPSIETWKLAKTNEKIETGLGRRFDDFFSYLVFVPKGIILAIKAIRYPQTLNFCTDG